MKKPSQEELSLLENESFYPVNDDKLYLDFERLIKEGYGEIGNDRLENLTFSVEEGKWYSQANHRDENGNFWYEGNACKYGTLQEALDYLKQDMTTAPKQPTEDFKKIV